MIKKEIAKDLNQKKDVSKYMVVKIEDWEWAQKIIQKYYEDHMAMAKVYHGRKRNCQCRVCQEVRKNGSK